MRITRATLRYLTDLVGSRLPTRSRAGTVHRLIARANAERDSRRYHVATAFYEEALRLSPYNPRVHVQYAHMLKESGNFDEAGDHYRRALAMLPDDADLALQMGHFHKLADQPQEAEDAYRRALLLRPGWIEPQEEIRRLALGPARAGTTASMDGLVPELLPLEEQPVSSSLREGFHVKRLGANRAWTGRGYRRVLRGVEAIRGFVVTSRTLVEVALEIDGRLVARERLSAHPLPDGQKKYVFNIWYDFSELRADGAQVALRAADGRGWSRAYRAALDIVAPFDAALAMVSDTIIPPVSERGEGLVDEINNRPSLVRPARRALLHRSPRAILVQRADQLGDLACSIPALARLRLHFPDARIVALLTSANADLGRTLPMIDEVIIADLREEVADGPRIMLPEAQAALKATLSGHKFDIALDLAETGNSRPLLLLSGARFLYGYKGREFPWLTAGIDLDAHDPGNHHEMTATAQKLVALVDGLAALVRDDAQVEAIDPGAGSITWLDLHTDQGYVVLHGGARLAYSRWPGFNALAMLILEHTELAVVLLEANDVPADLAGNRRVRLVNGLLPFAAFDALLAGAAAFVGNDSGPKHLASLRGTPVISLHMARLNWNEWGQSVTGSVVSRQVPCAGCGIGIQGDECGKDFACIRLITPEEVFTALKSHLLPGAAAQAGCETGSP